MPAPAGTLRRSLRFRGGIVLSAALACAAPSDAATPPPVRLVRVPVADGVDLRFAHVSLEPSTVRGIITRIVQDDRGFLWFGTNHGLLRYDGYQFRAFVPDPDDPHSIRGTNVLALTKDRSGNLWVGSDQHVDRYDPVTGLFQHVLPDVAGGCGPASIVRDIAQDRNGHVWVSTDSGLVRLDPSTSKTTCYQHGRNSDASLASDLVKTALETSDGSLWVATSQGLDELDRATGRVTRHVILRGPSGVPLSLDGNTITVFEDHAGVLWITIPAGQETGLVSFDRRSGVQNAYLFGAGPAETAFSIFEDEDHALWFGMWQHGIVRFDRERQRAVRYAHRPNDRTSPSPGTVISLFQDRERRIWAGCDPPIIDFFDLRPSPFQVYRSAPDDPDNLSNAVVSVLEDSRGMLWVGRLSGLDRIDRRTGRVTRYVDTRVSGRSIFRTVHAIAEDRAGYLWFGQWGKGLDRFDPRTGGFRFYKHDRDNPASLSSDIVQSLYVDRRGTVWAGGYNALDRFDPATEQFRTYRSSIPGSSQYRAITEDPTGALWLASLGNGLHRFDPTTGEFTVYRKKADDPQSLSNDIVNTAYVDRAGTVWAGTSYGLCGLDQTARTFTCFHASDGLASSVVEGILEDERGDLWVSTSDGLSRFNPRTRTFRNYYVEDGLPSDEFRFAAASRSAAGEMFFGSTSGLLSFLPKRVVDDRAPPPVVLTDFWLFGNRLRAGQNPLTTSASYIESLTLGPRQNIFSFEFSALSYSNRRRSRYKYRLEGLEEQWNERDSSQRLVTYTTLPPGDYVFRVKASNSLGVSSEKDTSVRVRILPPWWSTWWFRAGAVAVSAALLCGLYRWRMRRLRQEERRLRHVINTVPASVWSTSPDGAVDFVNDRWQELTGLPAKDTLGWNWESVVHPDDRKPFVEKWREAIKDGKSMEHEVRVRHADGNYRWFYVRNVPLRDQKGQIVKWYGTSVDIEDRKRAEEERERLRQLQADLAHINRISTLGELTASIAHELKQPMTAAIINTKTSLRWLARDEPDLQEARNALLRAVSDNTRGVAIIERLRSLYKKSGSPERELVDVNELVCEMLVLLRSEAVRYSISMQTELAGELPRTRADRVQLQQVFMNLMLNSIEAMTERGGELTVKSERTGDGQLLISISDSGVGLPADQEAHIFDAFFTTKSQGTGMGLAISRTIVESHGGRLWASANAGHGATFSFTLPAAAEEQAARATGT